MTKVQMSQGLFDYQEMMKDTLRETIRQHFVAGVRQADRGEVPFVSKSLLPPPQILAIFLEEYKGTGDEDDYIAIVVRHDFGIGAMDITIWDESGNLVEHGQGSPFPNDPELWDYVPTAQIPADTLVMVQVTAVDCMGGVTVNRDCKRLASESE